MKKTHSSGGEKKKKKRKIETKVPVQVVPFPEYPLWQAQVKDPMVFVHVDDPPPAQLLPPPCPKHSFTSLQVTPSPEYPLLQAQV